METTTRQIEIWGLCSGCRGWFSADEFFNHEAPTPVCGDCDLPPERLAFGERPTPPRASESPSELWLG